MFSICKETGWSEDYVLDMPLGRAWAYRHCVLRSYDALTYYKSDNDDKRELYELFNTL